MLKIVDLVQDTPEWHAYRKTRMGASDFALYCCHLGLSKPIFQIDFNRHIYNKINGISINNPYMQRGKDMEPDLLYDFNKCHGLSCFPLVLERDGLFASLDGFDIFNNVGVEIKTTSKSSEKLDKLVQYYQFQLYQQMHCAYLDKIYLLIHFVNEGLTYITTIEKNDIPMTVEQHSAINNDYISILTKDADNNMIQLLNKYDLIKEQIKTLTAQKDEIIKSIDKEGVYGNYLIKKISKKTANYSKFVKDNELTLSDDYYSNTEYFKITNVSCETILEGENK